MGILCFSISLVTIAMFLHLILLKAKFWLSGNSLILIILIFSAVLIFGFTAAMFLNGKCGFLPATTLGYLQVVIFYVPVMLSYMITYVALEDDSPSMTIVRFVEKADERGRTRQEIRQIITNEVLILPRIGIMLKDAWIEYKNSKYYVTQKGMFYNRFFAFGLKLLKISREG